MTTNRRGWLE